MNNMASELVTALIGIFCTAASSIITFILTRRKYNTEVEAGQIENMKQSFNAYKTMMEETVKMQGKRIDALQRENESLRNQLSQLQSQVLTYMLGKKLGLEGHIPTSPITPTDNID